MRWFDSESCGLVGPTFTLQYAEDEGRIHVHEIWYEKVRETLRILEWLLESPAAWNIVHDWLHVQRLHNIFSLLPLNRIPVPEDWVRVQTKALAGPCLKPRKPLDLFLFARRGPWQSLMNRDDIRIRRVPAVLAELLAQHLTSKVELDPIYFSRRSQGYEWIVDPESLKEDPEFPDVILRFGASGGLKPLARHLLGVEVIEFDPPDEYYPEETGWNLLRTDWTKNFKFGRDYWHTNKRARKYMIDDVKLLRDLWHHFGCPPAGDTDSVLACQVASSRWRGYAKDKPAVEKLVAVATRDRDKAPRDWRPVLAGLHERMSGVERIAVEDTRGETLEEIGGAYNKGAWTGGWSDNVPARDFARSVTMARSAEKLVDYGQKLLACERGHPSFRIIATLSDRMGGTDGFNWQGLPEEVKACLTLADGNHWLEGGDFWAFEVTLAAAVYKDEQLIADLRSGKKMHALFGSNMFEVAYEELYDQETEKAVDKERYDLAKRGFFAKMFGAQDPKMATTMFPQLPAELGIQRVQAGSARFESRYPGIGRARKKIEGDFCSMRQPGGIGSKVEWHEPKEYVDSLLGSRRYFTLENKIGRALFELGNKMPSEFHKLRFKVSRRAGRIQTPGGASQSAVFAAAFNIQARAMRSAANHEIQASGARITKEVQEEVWTQQPFGVHEWVVQPLNEHDSVMVPTTKCLADVVSAKVETYRPIVPLIRMDWKTKMKNWGEK